MKIHARGVLYYLPFCFLILMVLFAPKAYPKAIAYVDKEKNEFVVKTLLIFKGPKANKELSKKIIKTVNQLWNEPSLVYIQDKHEYPIRFEFTQITKEATEPQMIQTGFGLFNFQTILEHYPFANLITVDALGSRNSHFIESSSFLMGTQYGDFSLKDNLAEGTTVAHEIGHSFGLDHIENVEKYCRAELPSIMCARGSPTLKKYQWIPTAKEDEKGASINPIHRHVTVQDVLNLELPKIPSRDDGVKIVGAPKKPAKKNLNTPLNLNSETTKARLFNLIDYTNHVTVF